MSLVAMEMTAIDSIGYSVEETMEPDYLKNVVAMLEEEKRSRFGDQALMKIKGDLLREPRKALDNAFDRIVLEFNNLPSPAKFLALVREEGEKLRSEEARKRLTVRREAADKTEQEKKEAEYLAASVLTRKYGAALGQEWLKVMEMTFAVPKVPKEEIIAAFRDLDRQFPGLGFDRVDF